jgi:hypothetical protein
MVCEALEATLLTELVQPWELILQPLLLFAAFVALDISKHGYFSLRQTCKKELASGIFYFTLVFFMRFVLIQTLEALIAQAIVLSLVWFSGLIGLILLTSVVFKDAVNSELQFKWFSERIGSLESRFVGLLNTMNQLSQMTNTLKTQLGSTTQSSNSSITLLIGQVRTLQDDYKRIVEDYKALVSQYRADTALSSKRLEQYESLFKELQDSLQSLLARVEELTRLQREYMEKVDRASQVQYEKSAGPEETEGEPLKLTKENGITNRKKGNNAQIETFEYLKGLGFFLENDCASNACDFLFYGHEEMVGIGAHKAFTLTRQGTRQRSISTKTIHVEYETAKELRLPLILFVLNLDNKQRWAHFIPNEELGKFKSVSTPLILAENTQEAYQTLHDTILEVKKRLSC